MFFNLGDRDREVVLAALRAYQGDPELAKNVAGNIEEWHKEQSSDEDVQRMRDIASEARAKGGDIEFDDDAIVSQSSDGGAYVLAWVWVDDPEQEMCDECSTYNLSSDTVDGTCADCRKDMQQDAREQFGSQALAENYED